MPVVLTFDIDWAPDFMIDFVAEGLLERRVRATWFVTHASPAVERLRDYPDLFELGIHPNFAPGSTQGDSPEAVLRHCLRLVPEARSMRTHGLVQSTQLLQLVARATPIEHDLSLYLPRTPGLRAVEYRFGERPLVRLPYLWEDDFEMLQGAPWWGLAPVLGLGEGLKVLDFHPVHVFLNLPNFAAYAALRDAGRLNGQASAEALRPHIHQGAGPQTMFGEALEHLSRSGRSWRVQDLCAAALPPPLPPEMPEAGEARP